MCQHQERVDAERRRAAVANDVADSTLSIDVPEGAQHVAKNINEWSRDMREAIQLQIQSEVAPLAIIQDVLNDRRKMNPGSGQAGYVSIFSHVPTQVQLAELKRRMTSRSHGPVSQGNPDFASTNAGLKQFIQERDIEAQVGFS